MLLPRPSSTQGSERRGRALSAASYLTDAMEGEDMLELHQEPSDMQMYGQQVTWGHMRSPEVTRGHLWSPEVTCDH